MWYRNQDRTLRGSNWGNPDRTRIKAGSKLCLLCYTRERVKREEKEILQHQTTSLYIHCVCHPRIIPHAPIYHLNIQPWSYTPPTQLLSIQPHHIVRHCNTSNHMLIITSYTTTFAQHPHAVPTSLDVSTSPLRWFLPLLSYSSYRPLNLLLVHQIVTVSPCRASSHTWEPSWKFRAAIRSRFAASSCTAWLH